jgi:hypothetical protein
VTAQIEGGAESATIVGPVAPCARCEPCERSGAADAIRYCGCCGRELARPRNLSTRHFLKDAVVAITDVDSALISSFRSLLTKPGELTREYLHGDRSRFLAPFRLFLLCNFIYFVAAARLGIGVLTVPLHVQTNNMVYQDVARGMVNEHLHMRTFAMTLEQAAARDSVKNVFAAQYDGATEGIGKVIVAVLIPLYAILIQILYIRQRRFFAEHLILATHLTSFMLLAIVGMALVANGLIRLGRFGPSDDDLLFGVCFSISFSIYAAMAQRTAYQTGWRSTAVRTAVLAASIVPMLVILKFILFLVTLYWIG